ncbi:MAG: aminotransferase-like domain-containing protein [Chloroflexus sp.]|uniref:aminotransferase-like domain-containing protein n=1 Tax=Chloroflexus sp. TaxID=1904827 RepID=UPI00404A7FD5
MLPDIQFVQRPGVIEFGWGHLAAELLPHTELLRAATWTLTNDAPAALTYGFAQGPGRLIAWLAERMAITESELMITGGTSQALDMLCKHLSQSGDVVLVEAPTYHLALRIFRDYKLRPVMLPGDQQGVHVTAVATLVKLLRQRGERIAFLYLVPSFRNPSGVTLSAERRAELARLATALELTIIEDEAYAELWYDLPPPPPIASFAPGSMLIRLGSFAKVLAPGLRLGWMQASSSLIQRCISSGMLDSGGGVNHFTAHVVLALLRAGDFEPHLLRLRDGLRVRRDTLLIALARTMPRGVTWRPPLGGFFVWLRTPPTIDTTALLPIAEAAGVSYIPGERFYAGSGGRHELRLAFSLLSEADLIEGARRLGKVLREAG